MTSPASTTEPESLSKVSSSSSNNTTSNEKPLSNSSSISTNSANSPSKELLNQKDLVSSKDTQSLKDLLSPEFKEPLSPLSSSSSLKSPDSTTLLSSSNSPSEDTIADSSSSSCNSSKINVNPISHSARLSSVSGVGTCKICGDKADTKYYGVVTCDSCRGFFKRAIKNARKYACIGKRDCVLNKKTRNHCKACRLTKCYKVGMQKDVAEKEIEREKKEKLNKRKQDKQMKESSSSEVSSSLSDAPTVQTIDLSEINSAELFVDPKINNFANIKVDPIRQLCLAADKQLASLAEWAKRLPLFTELTVTDQVKLLQWNWAELLIGGFCYRSSAVSDGILLATGLHLSRENLQKAGVGTVVNRLFGEVINKMQKLQIDVSEWGCLRAMMLFAPDTKELTDIEKVENIRERYIATLCEYEKRTYPSKPERLGNLLLRLPPLKAIALQVLEHLFFFKLIGDVPIDTFLLEMLDVDNH